MRLLLKGAAMLGFILVLSLLLVSCHWGKRRYVMPEKKLVKVLVDIHLADGIAVTTPRSFAQQSLDSAVLYSAVFTKHRINRAIFDSTMSYYTQKPNKLQQVYINVNTVLSKMDSDLEADGSIQKDDKNILIWQDNKTYSLPRMGAVNRIEITAPAGKPGFYTVSAKIRLMEEDQAVAPRMTIYYWYDNGTPKGYREYFRNTPLKKAEKAATYSVTQKLVNPKITHIKGFLLDHSNPDTLFTKHATVSEIKVYFRE